MSATATDAPVTGTEPTLCEIQKKKVVVTERAAAEVKKIIAEYKEQQQIEGPLYLRLTVVGGGCSGFQKKLDLTPHVNEKIDEVMEFHGISVVIDKRSLIYLEGATVDFHDELNRRGFSITVPNAKSTCGCGSSFSM